MFPSLEKTRPLEKGCSQAALQTAIASEGPRCFAEGCAPEEDAARGGPAETCLSSASCQLPQGEDGLGTAEWCHEFSVVQSEKAEILFG